MKVSSLLVVLSISSALFACSSSSPTKPSVDLKQIEQAVRRGAENNDVIEESVLRNDGKVYLAMRMLESKDKAVGELYLRADCSGGGVDWVYADILDRRASPAKKDRHYADGTSLYSQPRALSESVARAVRQLNVVKKACDRTPSWREIAYNKKNETQLLLEISSLQPRSDGSVRFWVAVDYPYLAYIRQYKAPYAKRAGFYEVDCQKQSYSLLHVYYLDQQQTVTDGGMQVRPPVLDISKATGDSATLLSTICSQENLAQTLLPPEPRGKRLPNFSALPDPDERIANQLTQLKRYPPSQSISFMRIEGTRTSLSGSAAARLSKSGFFRQEISIEATPTPGVFYVTYQEGDDRTEQMSFLGIVPISQMLYSAEEQHVFQIDKLELRGDWEKMPVDNRYGQLGQLGYWQRMRVTDLMTNQSNRETEVICKVARELPAAELHSRFQGRAKELRCHVVGGKIDEISNYYYLEDYAFGFLLGSTSSRYTLNSRVVEVR